MRPRVLAHTVSRTRPLSRTRALASDSRSNTRALTLALLGSPALVASRSLARTRSPALALVGARS
eukprot:5535064-Pleurochrysis_carterae.AAC.1